MSILNNLGKIFIRSAVSQVGRDGGRVISSKVYGNKHAVPIRSINSELSDISNDSKENYANREELISAGFRAELFSQNLIGNMLTFGGGFITPILGPLFLFFISLRNIFRDRTRFYRMTHDVLFVRDNRYKTGTRANGTKTTKEYALETFDPISSEKIIYVSKGIIALILALLAIWFQYSFYKGDI